MVEYALMLAFAVLLVLVGIRSFSNEFREGVVFISDEVKKAMQSS